MHQPRRSPCFALAIVRSVAMTTSLVPLLACLSTGDDGGPCFPNSTCNDDLVCDGSQVCNVARPDPCDGITCSDHGRCIVSGTPASPACDCDNSFDAAALACLPHDAAPACASLVSVDSSYSGYGTAPLDDGIVDARGGTGTTWASASPAGSEHTVEFQFPNAIALGSVTLWWAWNANKATYTTSQTVQIRAWNETTYVTVATIVRDVDASPVSHVTFAPVETSRLQLFQAAGQGPVDYVNVLWLTEVDYGPSADCLVGCGVCGSYCGDETCDDGESSTTCAYDCPLTGDPCAAVACSGHGTCIVNDSGFATCDCNAEYHPVDLTCVADAPFQAVLTWDAPTTNDDSSSLVNLAGYRVYWGTASATYPNQQDLGAASCAGAAGNIVCTHTVTELTAGTYYFAVTAYNSGGYESVLSNEASKVLP